MQCWQEKKEKEESKAYDSCDDVEASHESWRRKELYEILNDNFLPDIVKMFKDQEKKKRL